jgi:hypothetical protein
MAKPDILVVDGRLHTQVCIQSTHQTRRATAASLRPVVDDGYCQATAFASLPDFGKL